MNIDRRVLLVALLATILPSVCSAQSGTRNATARSSSASSRAAAKPTGVVVVELFTSQGCSSCPPADAALRQVDAVAEKAKLPVYALSFHVDYWNRLGWTDPYSDRAFSQRQSAYASAAGSKRVYTPQMIVNGTTEFVGSDKSKAHAAITSALGRKSASKVALAIAPKSSPGQLSIRFQVSGATASRVLNVAVIRTPAANDIPKGENAGRTLSHVNVVRAFKTVPLEGQTGSVTLQLPADVDRSSAEVVAYVQHTETRAISGAASIGAG